MSTNDVLVLLSVLLAVVVVAVLALALIEVRRGLTRISEGLAALGAAGDLWGTIFHHRLDGGAMAVVEWVKGTLLRPTLPRRAEPERARFLADYAARIFADAAADRFIRVTTPHVAAMLSGMPRTGKAGLVRLLGQVAA